MGTKQVTVRFCDCCDKEIVGRLTLHTCPVCGKDICVECQEKEDARHKPRERKPKTEQPMEQPGVKITAEPNIVSGKKQVIKERTFSQISPDISTFSVTIGQGDELHQIHLGAQVVGCATLKEGTQQILAKFGIDQQFVEDAPESEGKRNLLDILNTKGGKDENRQV